MVTASENNTAQIWEALPTGQVLIDRIRARLDERPGKAPPALKIPEGSRAQEDTFTLVITGLKKLSGWLSQAIEPPVTADS